MLEKLPIYLLKLIKLGENTFVEYKSATTKLPDSLFETICSMLNRGGGHIFLDVEDNDHVIGVKKEKINQMKNVFANLCINPEKLNPTAHLEIKEYLYEKKITQFRVNNKLVNNQSIISENTNQNVDKNKVSQETINKFENAIGTIDRNTVLEVAKALNIHQKSSTIEQDANMMAKSGRNTNPKIVNVDKFIKEYENLDSLRKKVIEIAKQKIKGKSVVIKDTQTLTDFNEKGLTKTFSGRTVEEKLQSVDVLEKVLEEGIYYNTSYDVDDVNGIKYHNFLTPVKAYNKKGNAFIRSVVKEYTKQSDIKDKFYYHQFEYIDNNKNETIRSISSTNDEQRTLGLPRSNNNIAQSNNKVKLPTAINNSNMQESENNADIEVIAKILEERPTIDTEKG